MRNEEEDEDFDEDDEVVEEPRVIEISQTVQMIAVVVIAIIAAYFLWKFTLGRSPGENIGEYSAVPALGPKAAELPEGVGMEAWAPKAKPYGRDLPPSFTLEELGQADLERLDEILVEFEMQGLPDPDGQESQIFESLIIRGVILAPKRTFAYVREVENPEKQEFAFHVLYRRWFAQNFEEAATSLALTNEKLSAEVVESAIIALGRKDPERALALAEPMERDHFRWYSPDFHGPLFKALVREDESGALTLLKDLSVGSRSRAEAVKGILAGKLDSGVEPETLTSWLSQLPEVSDRTEAGAMLLQFIGQQGRDAEGDWVDQVQSSDYGSYFQRLEELRKLATSASPELYESKIMAIFRSHPVTDPWGRLIVANQIPESSLRDEIFSELARPGARVRRGSFTFRGHYYPSIAIDEPIERFRDLLDEGQVAFDDGELEEARAHWLLYLCSNHEDQAVRAKLIELSKARGTWLGENLALLDGITMPAITFPAEGEPYGSVIGRAQQLVEDARGFKPDFYLADEHPKADYTASVVGEYPDQPIREGLVSITNRSGVILTWEEFGILVTVTRDPVS